MSEETAELEYESEEERLNQLEIMRCRIELRSREMGAAHWETKGKKVVKALCQEYNFIPDVVDWHHLLFSEGPQDQ